MNNKVRKECTSSIQAQLPEPKVRLGQPGQNGKTRLATLANRAASTHSPINERLAVVSSELKKPRTISSKEEMHH